MTALVAHRVGLWRALASGSRIFLPVVAVNAVLQALMVLGDPVPAASWTFGLLVVGSLLVMVVSIALMTGAAIAAVDGHPRTALSRAGQRPSVAAWVLGLAVLALAGAVVNPLIAPLVLLLGTFVLPAVAAGARHPVVAGFGAVARRPLLYLLAVAGFLILIALSWLLALVLGFFVTGFLGALATWVWFGAVAAVVLCLWCVLYRRATEGHSGG
jgi:hypothetical protein